MGNLNITRLECKGLVASQSEKAFKNLNITRLECKEVNNFVLSHVANLFEYNQIGM